MSDAINPSFAHISHGAATFQVLVYAPVTTTAEDGTEIPVLDDTGNPLMVPVDWDEAATRALYEAWLTAQSPA